MVVCPWKVPRELEPWHTGHIRRGGWGKVCALSGSRELVTVPSPLRDQPPASLFYPSYSFPFFCWALEAGFLLSSAELWQGSRQTGVSRLQDTQIAEQPLLFVFFLQIGLLYIFSWEWTSLAIHPWEAWAIHWSFHCPGSGRTIHETPDTVGMGMEISGVHIFFFNVTLSKK